MLIVVHGGLGSGKTLLLSAIAKYSKDHIVSNFHLNRDYEEFSLNKFVNAEYENCIILMDEAYVYLESRLSMSKVNRASSYILFQSRKKNVRMYLTVQMVSTLDVRFRSLTDLWIYCEGLTERGYKYVLIDNMTGATRTTYLPLSSAEKIYPIYDTNEVVSPNIESTNFMAQDELKNFVMDRVNEIRKHYGNRKITKNIVKKWYFEHGYPTSTIEMVYVYLKEQEETGEIVVESSKKSNKKKKK